MPDIVCSIVSVFVFVCVSVFMHVSIYIYIYTMTYDVVCEMYREAAPVT